MDFNRVVYLATIQQAGGTMELSDLWNDLVEVGAKLPDFKLKQSNFYVIIGTLEHEGMISSKSERRIPHSFASKKVSITPAGLKYVESYAQVLPLLIPPHNNDLLSPKRRGKIHLEQDDLVDLSQSIIFEISNNLFNMGGIDEKVRTKIEKTADTIMVKIQNYL